MQWLAGKPQLGGNLRYLLAIIHGKEGKIFP
jgi:hypothetical protein